MLKSVKIHTFYWIVLYGLVARVTLFNRTRSADSYSAVDFSALMEVLLIGMGGLVILLSKHSSFIIKSTIQGLFSLLFLYYSLCVVSSLWSYSPLYTFIRSAEVTVLLFICSAAMAYYNSQEAEKALLMSMLLFIILFVSMHIKLSFSFHTNAYSAIAGASFAYCIAEYHINQRKKNKYLLIYAIIFLAFLILGTSSASLISTFIGILFVYTLSGKRSIGFFLAIIAIIITVLTMGAGENFILSIFFPDKDVHDITSLRGRLTLWNVYWEMFKDSPFFGHGFAIVARISAAFGGVNTTNTHNGFIEAIMSVGLVGAAFFIAWIFYFFRLAISAHFRYKSPGIIGVIAAITVFLANNSSKTIIGGAFDPTLICFLLFASYLNIVIREHQ